MEITPQRVQIIKCPCGSVVSAYMEPECYEDAEYQRETRKRIKKGYTVSSVERGAWEFGECTCETTKNPNQTQIFTNQPKN